MKRVTEAQLRELLSLDHIAVVGRVGESSSAASEAITSLRREGYDVVAIPKAEQPSDRLRVVDQPVEIVTIYDREASADTLVADATARPDVSVFWTQPGAGDERAVRQAKAGGLLVVEERDICVDYRRVFG